MGWIAGTSRSCSPGSGPCTPVFAWTADGGTTWRQAYPSLAPTQAVARTPSGTVYGLGSAIDPLAVYRGDSATAGWARVGTLPSFAPPFYVVGAPQLAFASRDLGYAFDLQGHLLRTADGGAHWQDIPLPEGTTILGMSALPAGSLLLIATPPGCQGLAGCHDVLWKISQGSLQHSTLHAFPAGWLFSGLAFLTERTGYALGDTCYPGRCLSALWRTADGGRTWRRATLPRSVHLFSVLSSPAPGVLALSTQADFALSRDGGKTWQEYAQRHPGEPSNATNLQVVADGRRLWLLTVGGLLYRSTDGGRTWR